MGHSTFLLVVVLQSQGRRLLHASILHCDKSQYLQALKDKVSMLNSELGLHESADKQPASLKEGAPAKASQTHHGTGSSIDVLVPELLQLLRLYCCSYRRTLRHATKTLHTQMKQITAATGREDGQLVSEMNTILTSGIKLVEVTVNAIGAMESVGLQSFHPSKEPVYSLGSARIHSVM